MLQFAFDSYACIVFMSSIIHVSELSKVYASGFEALSGVDLDIQHGEIFALLGPNGAGKTTLISIICGIVNATGGTITVEGHDSVREFRQARARIGLVPQELAVSMFESVWTTVKFSRGLYGKTPNDAYLEQLLRDLSLWDKKDSKIMALSGGMKRRVLIAKALAHEPTILFLDEPTAGVDVELRKDMWQLIRKLRDNGVTIILTTHYINEAEQMADRIGIILNGKIVLVDDKDALMSTLGKKQLILQLNESLADIPASLTPYQLQKNEAGTQLVYEFDSKAEQNHISALLKALAEHGIEVSDLKTHQSSLEDIFVHVVGEAR